MSISSGIIYIQYLDSITLLVIVCSDSVKYVSDTYSGSGKSISTSSLNSRLAQSYGVSFLFSSKEILPFGQLYVRQLFSRFILLSISYTIFLVSANLISAYSNPSGSKPNSLTYTSLNLLGPFNIHSFMILAS